MVVQPVGLVFLGTRAAACGRTTPPLAAISSGGMSNYRGKYVTVGPVIYGVSMFIELIYNFVFIYINIYSIEMYY